MKYAPPSQPACAGVSFHATTSAGSVAATVEEPSIAKISAAIIIKSTRRPAIRHRLGRRVTLTCTEAARMEKIVPLISSDTVGLLGIRHLPRLWLKTLLYALDALPEG